MSLYDLTGEILQLQEMLESDEFDPEAVKDTLDGVTGEFNDKLENYCKIIKNFEGEIAARKIEIDRLSKQKKTLENRIESLKKYMFDAMKVTGNTKIKGSLFTVSIQANGGKIPIILDVDDTSKLPDDLVRIKEEPDLDAIRELLENGKGSEYAHFGERGESLRIK